MVIAVPLSLNQIQLLPGSVMQVQPITWQQFQEWDKTDPKTDDTGR